ncbi:MAG: polymer-forming cytoskeletal protein [Gemmatimonadales bacterium]|nr:polymer-forming cytoskeletal protein [Gemmatimonadales bacterium]
MFRRREATPPPSGLVVGPADRVHGVAVAQSVTVAGQFEGRLEVHERLAVVPGGVVHGTIGARELAIEPGATVRAECRVGFPLDAPVARPLAEPAAVQPALVAPEIDLAAAAIATVPEAERREAVPAAAEEEALVVRADAAEAEAPAGEPARRRAEPFRVPVEDPLGARLGW